MALTPDDLVNKQFQRVKFREGYDPEDVDDFLDEVIVEFRRLTDENDDLRQKLSAAEQRLREGGHSSVAEPAHEESVVGDDAHATQAMPAAMPEPAPQAEAAEQNQTSQTSPLVAPQTPAVSAPAEQPAPEPEAPVAEAPAMGFAAGESAAASTGPQAPVREGDAHGLIALAQKVHDEHIAEGKRTRDKLVADAEREADEILSKAEQKRSETLSQLESQKATLEREIDGLQNFERQYRTRLKSYLSDQLRDLESSGSLAPETLGGSKLNGSRAI